MANSGRSQHALILAVALAVCQSWVLAFAADVDGATDHPMISRYPGQEIRWYDVQNFMPYKVPVGPVTGYRHIDDWIETQGQVTRIFYVYEGRDRTHTEIWQNYVDALNEAGFTILGAGAPTDRAGKAAIGGRTWQGVVYAANPWEAMGEEVNTLTAGTATSGGSAAVVASRERAAGTVYVVINVEQHSVDYIGTLVDIIEVEEAETGLIVVDAEAIGEGVREYGRVTLDGILFDFDTADLRPDSEPALDAIADYLRANADKNFYVVGHTDARGGFAYNQKLSSDRARAVADALKRDYGIAGERLEPHGVGPLVPVFSNSSAAGRDKNRRVELVER